MKFAYTSGSRPLDGFTIKRGIGAGGFGEVYFATSDAGKEVALKRIQRNLDIELRGVRQCLNLKHVNLISLFDIKYDDEGEAWVVMEYVSGGETLKDVIEQHPDGLPTAEVERWFRGIAAGVGYLHDHGIVHRDLKPGNIFDDVGTVKIGDYGLSKFISCSRRSGQTESVGTFHYMAPEIGKGVYGKEIDIYALGIILFEMATGRVPFDGESSQEIMMKHLTEEPDLSCLPAHYARVVGRAMTKDPEQRFRNVAELLACLDGEPEVGAATPGGVSFDKPAERPSAGETADSPASSGDGSNSPPSEVLVISDEPVAPQPDAPLYIGDEAEEMTFGPLRSVPQPAGGVVEAEIVPSVSPRGRRRTVPPGSGTSFSSNWEENWSRSGFAGFLKIFLILLLACIALLNIHLAAPLAIAMGAVYLVYLGVRTMVNTSANREALMTPAFETRLRSHLACRPTTDRWADVTGGWLCGAVVVAALCLLSMALLGVDVRGISQLSTYTWSVILACGGVWGLIALGQRWQRSPGTGARRLTQLALGLGIGAIAFASSQYYQPELTNAHFVSMPQGLRLDRIAPVGELGIHLAYFGVVLTAVRWWKLVDPLRKHRFSLLAAVGCGGVAWITSMVLYFPQPWGIIVATSIAVAAQLSAPWVSWADRAKLRQEWQEV